MSSRRPRRRFKGRKSKFVTKRGLPFALMKFAEAKFSVDNDEFNVPDPSVFSTNAVLPLDIARGNGAGQRDGNTVQVSGYYISLHVNALSSSAAQFFRIIIYSPKDASDTTLPGTDTTNIPDPRRFIIWHDKTIVTSNVPGGGTGVLQLKKRFKPYMLTEWDDSTSTNWTKNTIIVQFIASADNTIHLKYSMKTYFRDV